MEHIRNLGKALAEAIKHIDNQIKADNTLAFYRKSDAMFL